MNLREINKERYIKYGEKAFITYRNHTIWGDECVCWGCCEVRKSLIHIKYNSGILSLGFIESDAKYGELLEELMDCKRAYDIMRKKHKYEFT